jgi:hypothetical protein
VKKQEQVISSSTKYPLTFFSSLPLPYILKVQIPNTLYKHLKTLQKKFLKGSQRKLDENSSGSRSVESLTMHPKSSTSCSLCSHYAQSLLGSCKQAENRSGYRMECTGATSPINCYRMFGTTCDNSGWYVSLLAVVLSITD